jgi:hypothetical protein
LPRRPPSRRCRRLRRAAGGAGYARAPAAEAQRVEVRPQRDWSDAVLYFVILDRFANGDPANDRGVDPRRQGGLPRRRPAGLRQQLDEISGLGATALWITPVVQNIEGYVTGAGFPDWAYHGYWADDFEALDPRFGSEAELRQLVEEAHARGLKVLLDVVYNHVGYGSRYLTDPRTSGWLRSEERGTCGTDDLTLCVAGLPDLRTEDPDVAAYLLGRTCPSPPGGAGRLPFGYGQARGARLLAAASPRQQEAMGAGFFLVGRFGAATPGRSIRGSKATRWMPGSISRSRAASWAGSRAAAARSRSTAICAHGRACARAICWRTSCRPTTFPAGCI